MSPHRLKRSSVTVTSLFNVKHSGVRFVIADSSECAASGLLGARDWVVARLVLMSCVVR